MVDPPSDRVPRAPPYSCSRFEDFGFCIRGCHALRRTFPDASAILVFLTLPGGLLPFRSPLLRESRLISFPGLLRWFTSPSVAPPPYFIRVRGAGIASGGLPHSDIRGSRDMCSSPRLFAACRVLHRPSAPGHPPWTYVRLAIRPLHLAIISLLLLAFLPCTFQTSWDSAPRPLPFLGQTRVELVTPALSERCSNQLSYCPFCCPSAPSGKEKRFKSRQRLCTVHRYFPFLLERR